MQRSDKEERDARIFDMWLACHTQEEIAETEDVDQTTVLVKIKDFMDFGKLAKIHKTNAEYLDDFETPVYNIWKQQTKSNSVSHYQAGFGTIPVLYRHGTGHNLGCARHHAGYCLGCGG